MLPQDIQNELEEFVDVSSVLEVTNALRRQIQSDGLRAIASELDTLDMLIVHYDITSVYRFELEGYQADPGLGVIDLGDQIRIVSILPRQHQLLIQFQGRAKLRRRAKGLPHLLWRNFVTMPLRRARFALAGRTFQLEQDLYQNNHWVAQCYNQWRKYVSETAARKPCTRTMYIEPCYGMNGVRSFRRLP